MSSHREAPEISKDPVADSTDLYAFVDPNHPRSVTIIANYIPLEEPAGGPNFNEFGDDVLYEINVATAPARMDDVTYRFRFTTDGPQPEHLLVQHRAGADLHDENLNRYQTYSPHAPHPRRPRAGAAAQRARAPPANIGPSSTPDYAHLAEQAIRPLPGGGEVFCGPRADGFYVDLGSVFDLLDAAPVPEPAPVQQACRAAVGQRARRATTSTPSRCGCRPPSSPGTAGRRAPATSATRRP